jgi:hypothetical protein
MIAIELQLRTIENKDWATLIFLATFAMIVVAKSVFEARFYDFVRLVVSTKYLKIYKDSSHLLSGFNVLLFVVNIVSLSFFIQIVLHHFGYGSKTDWVLFVQIFTLLSVFILSKFLVEKIIAETFNIEELIEQFNLQKVTYRTYIGLLLLPVTILLFYSNYASNSIYLIIISILLVINAITYLLSLKIYQNLIIPKLFYFILYLCALEIAPYYFIYYLITKK